MAPSPISPEREADRGKYTGPEDLPPHPEEAPWMARAFRNGFRAFVALAERLLPNAVPPGESGPAANEAVRFHHDPSMAFSPGDLSSYRREETRLLEDGSRAPARYHVTSTFLGLSGTVSPLPDHFNDEFATEDPDAPVRAGFLDIFHHRLLSLLHRGVARFDRPGEFEVGGRDKWSRRTLAIVGIDAVERELPANDATWLLRLAPLLAGRGRGPHVLQVAIEDALSEELGDGHVAIREFLGDWIDIEPDDRARLSRPSMQLGRTAILGKRIFDRSARFGLDVGPVSYETMRRLLPGEDLHGRLQTVIARIGGRPMGCQLKIHLGADQMPGLRLDRKAKQGLGLDTWLGRPASGPKQLVVPLI